MSAKRLVVGVILVMATTTSAAALDQGDLSFQLASVHGNNGMSFVYLQATDSHGSGTPVPNRAPTARSACPVPYYSHWYFQWQTTIATEWSWKLFQCSTGTPVNPNSTYDGNVQIVTSDNEVVAGEYRLTSNGQAIYALDVTLDPTTMQPGQTANLTAAVNSSFVDQADRTLNISLGPDDWHVAGWSVDFGDGSQTTLPGGQRSISLTHTYRAAGSPRPTVVAHVAGTAQIADFDTATGQPVLEPAAFSVDVSNSTAGQVLPQPVVAYLPPIVEAGAAPAIHGTGQPPASSSDPTIEAFRGTLTDVFVRPFIRQEGIMTLDGAASGTGTTRLTGWQLLTGSGDGPPDQVTPSGAQGTASEPIVQQWDRPDAKTAGGIQPYQIQVLYTVETTYPDGHRVTYPFPGTIQVLVRYAAGGG